MSSYPEPQYGDSDYKSDYTEHYPGKYDCGSNLQPWAAYLIWFIVLIILIWILRAFGIRWFSAVVFSLVVSWIVLTCIYPYHIRDGKYQYCSSDVLLGLITVFTVILLIVWFIWKVFTDRDCPSQRTHHMSKEGHHMSKEGHHEGPKDANWNWQVESDSPSSHSVASGAGTYHREVGSSSSSKLGSSQMSNVPSTPVSSMGSTRTASGPF